MLPGTSSGLAAFDARQRSQSAAKGQPHSTAVGTIRCCSALTVIRRGDPRRRPSSDSPQSRAACGTGSSQSVMAEGDVVALLRESSTRSAANASNPGKEIDVENWQARLHPCYVSAPTAAEAPPRAAP